MSAPLQAITGNDLIRSKITKRAKIFSSQTQCPRSSGQYQADALETPANLDSVQHPIKTGLEIETSRAEIGANTPFVILVLNTRRDAGVAKLLANPASLRFVACSHVTSTDT